MDEESSVTNEEYRSNGEKRRNGRFTKCGIRAAFRVLRAVLIRVVFIAHALVMIWRLADIKQDARYMYWMLSVNLLLVEAAFTFKVSLSHAEDDELNI